MSSGSIEKLTGQLAELSSSDQPTRSDETRDSGVPPSSSANPSSGYIVVGTGTGALRRRDAQSNFVKLLKRPGCCAKGEKTKVKTNYYRLILPSSLAVYCYRVSCHTKKFGREVDEEKREICNGVFWDFFVQKRGSVFGGCDPQDLVYDDVHTLYSLVKLDLSTMSPGPNSTREYKITATRVEPRPQRNPRRPAQPPPEMIIRLLPTPMMMLDTAYPSTMSSGNQEEEVRREEERAKQKSDMTTFFGLLFTQQYRCKIMPSFNRFIVHGRNIFKVPEAADNGQLSVNIGGGMESWHGLHGAVKIDCFKESDRDTGTLYNVNATDTAFYKLRMNLIIFYAEICQGYKLNMNITREQAAQFTLLPSKIADLEKEIKGTKIIIEHPSKEPFERKVSGISMRPASMTYFTMNREDGSTYECTVEEYFYKECNFKLLCPHLPCIAVGKGRVVYYPMELCFTSLEPRKFKGRLKHGMQAEMIAAAQRCPSEQLRLTHLLTHDHGQHMTADNKWLTNFKVSIERKFMEVEALVMPPPEIMLKTSFPASNATTDVVALEPAWKHDRNIAESYFLTEEKNGKNYPRQLILKPPAILPFAVVLCNGQPDYKTRIHNLLYTCLRHGIEVLEEALIDSFVCVDRITEDDAKRIRKNINDARIMAQERMAKEENKREIIPLIIWVMENKNAEIYGFIKTMCDCAAGIVSQCIIKRTIEKIDDVADKMLTMTNTTTANMFLKISGKLGGLIHKIDRVFHKNWQKLTDPKKPTLFLGIDVSHPGPREFAEARAKQEESQGSRGGRGGRGGRGRGRGGNVQSSGRETADLSYINQPRSAFSVVGNIDVDAMKYGVSSRVQRCFEERSVHITDQIYERITEFKKGTGEYPSRIVVYRDGVSDSMFKDALYEESNCIRQALDKISTELNPAITYIVAQKRHHTRFFPIEEEDKWGPAGNTKPGFLVEKSITSNSNFDFFITSHYGSLGTSRPTHYTILRDDVPPKSNSFWQTVIYAHSYGYLRINRSISLPAPLQYAHLAAKKSKFYFDTFQKMAPYGWTWCDEEGEYYKNTTEEFTRDDIECRSIAIHDNIAKKWKGMAFI